MYTWPTKPATPVSFSAGDPVNANFVLQRECITLTCLLLHSGAGAAHQNGNIRDKRVEAADGACVLIGAACKPADKGYRLSLQLQVSTHKQGQDGSQVAAGDGVCNAGAVSQPSSEWLEECEAIEG